MERELTYRPLAEPLYNEAYLTSLGTKIIMLNGREYEVHETSNLRVLLDMHFHRQAGVEPVNFLEEVAARKLDDPALAHVLNIFFNQNPELTTVLQRISQHRDREYDARTRRREAVEQGLNPIEISGIGPSSKEDAQRDFVYSQVLDYIGDITIGADFDLTLLTR